MTMTARPLKVTDLKVWNYDGSSTGQADGHNSEVLLKPRAIFNDPFRGYPHVMVLADAWQAGAFLFYEGLLLGVYCQGL
ncbi:GLN1 [Symbiodinium sp. CCMP2592]|nr:GLN1 [Symbiodinium sp. CCMP2592]